MTAVYDAEGRFMYDDGESATDQSQFELTKRAESKQSPLTEVVNTFKNITTQFNPLMMFKTMQDTPRVAASLSAPLVAPAVGAIDYANKMPGVLLREKVLKDPQSLSEAKAIRSTLGSLDVDQRSPDQPYQDTEPANPSYATRTAKALAPKTQVGRDFLEGVGSASTAAMLPHTWPMGPKGMMSNIVGLDERRPLMSPNDVRVLGAQGVNTAREISAIPTDFANYRDANIVRESPVRGEGSTTFGGQLGQAAESLGDTMARREMQGLTPIPGLPAALQPDTKMYAVRPEGSRLNTFFPTIPPEAGTYQPRVNPIADIISTANDIPTLDPNLRQVDILDRAKEQLDEPSSDSYDRFIDKKAEELYPDLSARDRMSAVKVANYGDGTGSAFNKLESQWFDEWRNSPEGIAVGAQRFNSTEDIANAHKSAVNWLNTVFTNFVDKQWGASNNEVVKLAEKGLTVQNKEEFLGGPFVRPTAATLAERAAMGLDPQGEYSKGLREESQKVEDADAVYRQAAVKRLEASVNAQGRGVRPAEDKAFVAASREASKAEAVLNKAQMAWQNQQLAFRLETMADNSVVRKLADDAKADLVQHERQFYPTLEKTPGDEAVYFLAGNSALRDIANAFYKDVMSGKIKPGKMPNSVGQFVKKNAEARIMMENQAKAVEKERQEAFVEALMTRMEAIPDANKVGSIGVSVITKDLGLENVKHEFSIATAVCDFCLGEGGMAKDGTRNLFTGKKQTYEPQVNPITGKPNPLAVAPRMTYINGVMKDNDMVWIINEAGTGLPEGAMHLRPDNKGQYNVAGVYGRNNGPINSTHSSSIAAFMNRNADKINQVSEQLRNNAGIRDMFNNSDRRAMKADYGLTEDEARILSEEGTRFVTFSDTRKVIEDFRQASGVYQRPEITATATVAQAPPTPTPREVFQLQPFFDSVRRDVSAQVGDRVETVAYRVAENVNPNQNPEDYANALREAAYREQSQRVEISLNELAEEVEAHHRRQLIGEWEPDDQPIANRPDELGGARELYDQLIDAIARAEEEGVDLANMPHTELARLVLEDEIGYLQDLTDDQRVLLASLIEEHGVDNNLELPDDQHGANLPPRAVALQRQTLADVIQQGDVNNLRAMAFAMRGDNPNQFWSYLPRVERDAAIEAINERIQAVEALAADFGIRAVVDDLYDTEVGALGFVNTPGLEDTLTALRNGTIDHPAFRELPAALRRVAMNQVAEMLDERILPLREPEVDVDEEAALAAFDNADQVFADADFRPGDLAEEIFDYVDGERGSVEGLVEELNAGYAEYEAIDRLPEEYRELAMERVAGILSQMLLDEEARLMGFADEIADGFIQNFQSRINDGEDLTTRDANALLDDFVQDEQGIMDAIGLDMDEYRALFNTEDGVDEIVRRVRQWANDNLPQPRRRGYAKGGTVHRPATLDDMKFELMMRSA